MSQDRTSGARLPRGVTALLRSRGGRGFLAKIRHKGVEVHLGLYESASLAAFAFNVASEAVGRGSRPPNQSPEVEQPDPEMVRRIIGRVRARLGLDPVRKRWEEVPPDPEALLTLFEITVVGFWRDQGRQGDLSGLDLAAHRLAGAARLIFWSPAIGHPSPADAMARLVARRLDHTFRRSDITLAILDDDADDDWRVARWLVIPDVFPAARGFRDEVRFLYPELFEDEPETAQPWGLPNWASVLGVDPPINSAKVREAYRSRSKRAHPDAGGTHEGFIRLQAAYDEARDYCRINGV